MTLQAHGLKKFLESLMQHPVSTCAGVLCTIMRWMFYACWFVVGSIVIIYVLWGIMNAAGIGFYNRQLSNGFEMKLINFDRNNIAIIDVDGSIVVEPDVRGAMTYANAVYGLRRDAASSHFLYVRGEGFFPFYDEHQLNDALQERGFPLYYYGCVSSHRHGSLAGNFPSIHQCPHDR